MTEKPILVDDGLCAQTISQYGKAAGLMCIHLTLRDTVSGFPGGTARNFSSFGCDDLVKSI